MSSIAVVGVPNAGKTTLYNYLTGSRFKTVNYPGATVEYSVGPVVSEYGTGLQFVDTPGIYSLIHKSGDEEVTSKVIYEGINGLAIAGAVVLVDGTQLARQLPLVLQIKKTGLPCVVAITMADLLAQQNIKLDLARLSAELQAPCFLFNGLNAEGLGPIVQAARALPAAKALAGPQQIGDEELREGQRLAQLCLKSTVDLDRKLQAVRARTQSLDRYLLHPVLGLFAFFAIMTVLFASIYWVAQPFMDAIDKGFGRVGDWMGGIMPYPLLGEFVAKGIFAGVGAILVFVPQIFILFLGIGLLESTGYLARAASIIDRFFIAIGLSGRSFVPLLSGFSCAVPAMIASRNISSKRDRWITNFVIPLMTCSARLPVYALLLGFLFLNDSPWKAGLSLAALYFGALFVGAMAASILNRLLPVDKTSFLLMELPLYRKPHFWFVARQSLQRTWSYVLRAGPVIFVISAILWTASTFPHYEAPPAERIQTSYAGQLGHHLEPLFRPMGADWRVGLGLISAFAAREVFVSSLALTFNIADEDEDALSAGVMESMKTATFADGVKIFTPASVVSLIIFFMIALQCMSTFAVARKESGSFRFAFTQLVAFNGVAYVLAVAAYQGLSALGY